MKENNEQEILKEINNSKADDRENHVSGQAAIDSFNNTLDHLAKYGEKSLEQLERHARINAGYHDYEEDTFVDKQMVGNLCAMYKVFFEGNPKFNSFLQQMKEYAELDPYTHDNYVKEREFVSNLPKMLEELNQLLDEEELQFQEDVNALSEKDYNKLSAKAKEKKDHEFTVRSETIDNRRRALASFDMYFESISKGDMKDMDSFSADVNKQIADANKQKGRTQIEFQNEKGENCYYINSSGVPLNLSIEGEGLNVIMKGLAGLANTTSREEDIPDAPIFPHEPRFTDVAQFASGECYLYAGLANVCRLYPQKIKDMIKDNGDGTATVRLYGKHYDKNTYKTEYRPIYVRVDKRISKFGAVGALQYERMGVDCLWVNLIERAYAMSGLHVTYGEAENLPVDLNNEKNKNWKPTVSGIEGGSESAFIEVMLGAEGKSRSVDKLKLFEYEGERSALQKSLDKLERVKDMDVKSADSIARHAMYTFYKKSGGKKSEKEFQSLPEDKMIKEFCYKCDTQIEGADFEYFDYIYDALKVVAGEIIEYAGGSNIGSMSIQTMLGVAVDNGIDASLKKNVRPEKHAVAEKTLRAIYQECREGLLDVGLAADVPKTVKTDNFFNTVKNAIDKGLIVSTSTYADPKKMDLADEQHAYSIIGYYKTEDVPPKYYFRIKNPHTKLSSKNGVEYVNEDGKVVGKWVNVKDGIFDMELSNYLHDFENININGEEALEVQPHKSIAGYDVVEPKSIDKLEQNRVSNDQLVDYMKTANDLYDALISTNSKHSNDSDQYKNLSEGLKQFRHNLASAQGREIKDMKMLTQPLLELVGEYERHVDRQLLGASKRQKRRKAVCTEIRKACEAIDEGLNPHEEYEKEYAKSLINKYYEMNNIQDKSKADEVADRLYHNKAFRTIANNTNIVKMQKPSKNQMENDLQKIETSLKGRGIDKGIDLATMMPKKNGPAI